MAGILKEAMWVHGTSVSIEGPSQIESVWRAGFYTRIIGKPNTTNWLQFHIPTPVIVKGKRLMVDSAMLRYRCGSPAAALDAVHVYDGERRIAAHDALNRSPGSAFTFERFDVRGKPDVLWGTGISVGVRFGSGSAEQRTIEFSSVGIDFNLYETINVHVKVLNTPNLAIDTMFDSMREVYEPIGIRVVRASNETLNLPLLQVCDVGTCVRGSTTAEQDTLFANRNNAGANDVVIYFVQALNPPAFGCAAHPAGRPGAVVAQIATRWTMAHEIGHVLGLVHVTDNDRLMTGNGTNNITNPPPDLVASEITTMRSSPLTINP